MWDKLSILCALMCVAHSAPFPATPCPDSCDCTLDSGNLVARCSSFKFLEKLQPKQVNAIVSLDLSNKNLTKIHSKLKKLRNLKSVNLSYNNINDLTEISFLPKLTYLNLKSNHIKYFTASSLPKHLIHLDISHNYLNNIPQDLKHLTSLKEVNLSENPISCSCDILKERDALLNNGIILVKPVTCHSPKKLRGHLLQTAECVKTNDDYLDQMQGDEPAVEGSGDEEDANPIDKDIFDEVKNETDFARIEDEHLIPESPKSSGEAAGNDDDEEEEGSGDVFGISSTAAPEDDYEDEGSGDETTMVPIILDTQENRPKACNFDCSSPKPFEVENNDNATGDPDVLRELGIILGVVPAKPVTTEEPINEVVMDRIEVDKVGTVSRTNGEKEKIQEAINSADANEIKETDKSSINTNIIIVIALIAIMICLVVYSVIKKRRSRRRPEINEQEMKPLNIKPTNGSSNIPEKVPLMNGQNGNMNGKPVEEPVAHRRNEELDSSPPEDEVILRKKNKDEESLLPETHRVTIQAKELSTPKTPLLVNRLRSDDGQIITTLSPDQRV